MSDLLELAERCEREEPSRELDHAIGMVVGKKHPFDIYMPKYTSSLDAAVTLLADGIEWNITNLYGVAHAEAGLNFSDGNWQTGRHKGSHMALALCAAALKARSVIDHPPAVASGGSPR